MNFTKLLVLKRYSLPSLVVVFLLMVIAIVIMQNEKQRTITDHEVAAFLGDAAREQSNLLKEFIDTNYKHLYFLLDTPPVQGIDRAQRNNGIDPLDGTTTEIWKKRLSTIFISLANNYSNIFQVRLIETETGNELVRVDKLGNQIKSLSTAKLQNKGHTNYFTQTIKLPNRFVFISQLNLNRENGAIEYPLKPTIRFSTPIYNDDNKLFALLIINVSPTELIEQLQEISNKHNASLSILDQDQHIIEHTNEKYRFSKDFTPDIPWQKHYQLKPWHQKNINLITEITTGDAFLGFTNKVQVAPIEYGGASEFIFINYLSIDAYENILLDKQLANLGYLLIIILVFLIISIILIFYIKSAAALKKTRTEFEAIIQGASDGIIAIDNKLKILSFNFAAVKIFPDLNSVRRDMNLKELDLFSTELIEQLTEGINVQQGGYLTQFYNDLGTFRVSISPILDDKNELQGQALFIQDVSEQIKHEKEIQQINESLESQIKVRTLELEQERENAINVSNIKSKFVSTISHEMRTPLNGILGSLNLVYRERHSEKVKSLLDMMDLSATSLAALINDVLDLSKIEAGKLEIAPISFNPISHIEDVVASLSAQAFNKGLDLDLDVSQVKYFTYQADAGRLSQILNNLIGNAIKFTIEGAVYISAKTVQLPSSVLLEVDITDTGVGIEEADQDKLFQSFVQADKSISSEFGGTGLGLSISKQLCELMGGEISFVSHKGKGSTFSFTIESPIQDCQLIPTLAPLAGKAFKLLFNNEFLLTKWTHIIEMFGGSIAGDQPDFYLVDVHHPEYLRLKQNPELFAKSIILSRHTESLASVSGLFACLDRPTRIIAFIKLFTNDDRLSNYFYSLTNDNNESLNDYIALADKTILVVDDNSINLEIASHLLKLINVNVLTANTGYEALAVLTEKAKHNEPVDAILMDCQMPIMDGYEATQRIRAGEGGQVFLDIPIIALTANAMSDERKKCLDIGMSDYLTKPIDADVLFNLLASLILNDDNVLITQAQPQLPKANSLDKASALKRLMNDESLYQELARIFKHDTPKKIAQIKAAIAIPAHDKIRSASHALKGTSSSLGANILNSIACEFEQAALNENSLAYDDLMKALESEFARVMQQF